ncbi:MAG: P1 family peptidase [Salaquimonas sp.]|nr:P1 family peptidase [Salaquimonas sp.]
MNLPGKRNLITDVAGLTVGNAHDARLKSGVTAVLSEEPAVPAVHVMGGAPGTRETDLLEAHNTVQVVHALVLSGGSAFGLDAASGVQAALRERGIGLPVGNYPIPIVPAAILSDVMTGGDKDWGRYPPYRELAYDAVQAAGAEFAIGTAGSGTGAITGGLKGGLGSASTVLESGVTIGALVAVNSMGTVAVGRTRHFWAAPFEIGDEFGGLGLPHPLPANATDLRIRLHESAQHTTIGIIATDAEMTKAEAKRLAIAAHDGLARAIWPTHTVFDGDLVFAIATGRSKVKPAIQDFMELAAVSASTMARAIARAVYAATPADNDVYPVWSSRR